MVSDRTYRLDFFNAEGKFEEMREKEYSSYGEYIKDFWEVTGRYIGSYFGSGGLLFAEIGLKKFRKLG